MSEEKMVCIFLSILSICVTIIIISVQVYYQKVNSKIAEMVANGSDPFIASLALDNITDDKIKTYYLSNKHIDTTTKPATMKQI